MTVPDFADPVHGAATYRLCVYDGSASAQPLMEMDVPPGGTCGTKPCWKAAGKTGFKYKNKAGTPDGVTSLKLKAGTPGKPKVQAGGKGALLSMPALPWTLPVTVQLVIRDGVGSQCWQTTYSTSTANSSAAFSAKGP